MSYACKECGTQNTRWTSQCIGCRKTGTVKQLDEDSEPEREPTGTLEDAETIRGVRVSTGILGMDHVLGRDRNSPVSGLHVPSVVLFGGEPGSGKTTLLLHACSLMNRIPHFFSSEQQLGEIRGNIEDLRLMRLLQMHAHYTREIDEILEVVRKHQPKVAILDSLNKLKNSKEDTKDELRNKVRYIEKIIADAFEHDRAWIVTSHMNKDDGIAGLKELQHDVSTVMMLTKSEKPKLRLLSCVKNRFGSTENLSWFTMGEDGLREVEVTRDKKGKLAIEGDPEEPETLHPKTDPAKMPL